MRLPVGVFDVVHVVGGDDFEPELGGDLEQVGNNPALLLNAVIHDLDDEVILAENIDELGGGLAGLVELAREQEFRDDGGEAAGKTDQPLAVRGQRL